MTARSSISRVCIVAVFGALAFACSSAAETTGSSNEELSRIPKCSDGYTLVADSGGDGQNSKVLTTYSCDPFTIDQVTTGPALASGDACPTKMVPVPAGLAGMGCTLGIMVDGMPIFACPKVTAGGGPVSFPETLGLVGNVPECVWVAPIGPLPNGTKCEYVVVVDPGASFKTSCVGVPTNPDWVLVIDGLFNVVDTPVPTSQCGGPLVHYPCSGQPGGCHSGCPSPIQPVPS